MLVLGLDVLGNPYGLISGVGTGAKNFFYEPYQVCIFVFTLTFEEIVLDFVYLKNNNMYIT